MVEEVEATTTTEERSDSEVCTATHLKQCAILIPVAEDDDESARPQYRSGRRENPSQKLRKMLLAVADNVGLYCESMTWGTADFGLSRKCSCRQKRS